MAKRNPYTSADLGSGARTTTGGSYENPREGIQDYTAFGRGVASTFRIPEVKKEEERKDLNIDLGTFESEKDNFFTDTSGVMQDLNADVSILINNSWKNGELSEINSNMKNIPKGSQQEARVKTHLNGYNQAIGPKDSNFINYLAALDDGVHDHNVSNRQLPGLDGGNLNGTIADFIRIGNENPNAIKIASKPNKNGITQYGYEVEGLGFINATAMTDKWISKNMSVKYSQANSLSEDFKSFQVGNFKPQFYSRDTKFFEGTNNEFAVSRDNEFVQEGSINSFNNVATNAANQRFSSENDALFKSAAYQLKGDVKKGFKFSEELQAELAKVESGEVEMTDTLRLQLLKDHYQENFKLTNGSSMYVRGEDGRAIPKTIENRNMFSINKSTDERDISDGSGSGSGFSAKDFSIDFYGSLNKAIDLDTKGQTGSTGQAPFENFLQAYGVPVSDLQSITYKPVQGGELDGSDTVATDLTRLGQLNITWAREGYDDSDPPKKIVGAQPTTYDLTDKDGIRKLVTHMAAFSPDLKGSSNDAKQKRNALIEGYENVLQEVKSED